ncbi:MAG: restriction endonuclease, partial [Patescibacteria group bacterium]
STQQLHDRILHELERQDPAGAARYNLKHAMLHLGPTGYPFEQYFAQVMKARGWTARVGVELPGKCVMHEVDVLAEKDGKQCAVEAKYRNSSGARVDIKVALYVHARHEDLKAHNPSITGMLVTNTMFTRDAIAYGECMSMNLMAWNYPKDHTLANYIEELGLYPVTVFSQLPPRVVQTMANDGVVLAHHLCDLKPTAGRTYGLSDATFAVLQRDAKTLCDSLASS